MTEEETINWFIANPLAVVYGCFLILGGLISLGIIYKKISYQSRIGFTPLSHWAIKVSDFILFICLLVVWAYLIGMTMPLAYALLMGEEAEQGVFFISIAGLALQLGMLYIFFRFQFHFRSIEEKAYNLTPYTFPRAFKAGLLYFLAALPIIFLVGIIWNLILETLRKYGIDIQLPIQETITLFQNTDQISEFFALFFLAVIVAPIVEEYVFRAGVYRFFKGKMKTPAAMLSSGLLFGLVHANLQSLPGLIAVGVCLAIAYEYSQNIKVPIIFHALFNLNSIIWIILLPPNLI